MGDVERRQLATVVEILGRYPQVLWHHCKDSRMCIGTGGLPDLLLVGPGGLAFRELKASTQQMTRAQTGWRLMLRAAGADVGLWLPSDFPGTVEREISSLSRTP